MTKEDYRNEKYVYKQRIINNSTFCNAAIMTVDRTFDAKNCYSSVVVQNYAKAK